MTDAPDRWWAPVALAVGLRGAVAGAAWAARGPSAFLANDSTSYLAPAASLATSGAFLDAGGQPEIFRVPGYPLLLAAGHLGRAPLAFALLAQLALSALLVWRVWALARRLTGDARLAVIAATALAVEPTGLLWSLKVMPETLFALGVLTFVDVAMRYADAPSTRRAALAAAALAGAAFVKPAAYPLALALVVSGVVALLVPPLRTYRLHAAVVVAVTTLALGAWHVRNVRAAGYPGFSSQLDLALYVSAGGAAVARRDGVPFNAVRQRMLDELQASTRASGADAGTTHARARRDGLALVAADPVAAVGAHLAGSARTLLDPGAIEYARLAGAYPEDGGLLGAAVDGGVLAALRTLAARAPGLAVATLAGVAFTLPYLVAGVAASWWAPRSMRRACAIAGLVVAALALVSGGAPGSSRLRVPMMPLAVVLGTCALAGSPWWRRRTAGGAEPALASAYTARVTRDVSAAGHPRSR